MIESSNSDHLPLVSVCIPTYNRRDLLELTLETISNQTLCDFELIVCDDCSTDGTYEFLTSLKWPNLRILRNTTNLNIHGTMKRLFQAARGKYVGMQHDHDLYHPEFLERMVVMMERHPTAGFGCCAFDLIDSKDDVIAPPDDWFEFYPAGGMRQGAEVVRALATRVFTPIPAMGTLFRREIVEQAGGYRSDWSIASDEDLYRRVALISDVAFTREHLFAIRPRPVERHTVLGSWKSIYTLHEFRADTTRNYFKASELRLRLNLTRLRALRFKALVSECASLSLRGQYDQLGAATRLEAIPRLPSTPVLSFAEKTVLLIWSSMLKVICSTFRPWIRPRGQRRVG
jgi:glycosyltransferase involved in cell wall biosynthesis